MAVGIREVGATLLLLGALHASAGCRTTRGPNQLIVVAAQVAPAGSDLEGEESGVLVGGEVTALAIEARDGATGRARVDLAAGGNADGVSAQGRLEAEMGLAPGEAAAVPFMRGGFAAEAARNPYNGLSLVELPVLKGGLLLHDPSKLDAIHAEFGPRASLALAGVAHTEHERAPFVAAPTVGVAGAFLANGLAFEASYAHLFEGEPLELARATACVAVGLALCVDGRVVHARFGSTHTPALTTYVGLNFGLGIASGVDFKPL